MKTLVLLVGLLLLANRPILAADDTALSQLTGKDTPLKADMKIAFYGDSITLQGGYITILEKAIAASETTQDRKIKLIRHGLNGGRVPTVLEGASPWGKLGGTMQELLEKDQADFVIIYLGINDVWHGDKGTTLADYQAGLKTMVAMVQKSGAKLMLCTPSVIGEETEKNPLNDTLNKYADGVRELAKKEKITLCDIHLSFMKQLRKVNQANDHQGHLTYDGVHMNDAGNALLAETIAKSMDQALKK